MENAKRKRREVVNKNYGSKPRKKPRKRMKKNTKGKESFKTLIAGCCKLTAAGALKRLRIKDRQGPDGMFCKGLRSQYVRRETLNEVNEARKNEDINKIIDIGRVFFEKGGGAVPRGRVTTCREKSKAAESHVTRSEENSTDSVHESSPFTPISPPEDLKDVHPEREMRAFAQRYEASVAEILSKLPDSGVFEDALASLRKYQKKEPNSPDLFPGFGCSAGAGCGAERRDSPFSVEFLRDELEAGSTSDDFIFRESFPLLEETAMENSSGNIFVMNETDAENPNHPSYLNVFDNAVSVDESASSRVIEFHAKDFEKPSKELDIATPPIQFYRRNMF